MRPLSLWGIAWDRHKLFSRCLRGHLGACFGVEVCLFLEDVVCGSSALGRRGEVLEYDTWRTEYKGVVVVLFLILLKLNHTLLSLRYEAECCSISVVGGGDREENKGMRSYNEQLLEYQDCTVCEV